MALKEVLIDELRDMYRAENQLIKALPKLAKGSKAPHLKQLFEAHFEETKGHVLRLADVFHHLGEKPTGRHCTGMEGIVQEGAEALEKNENGASFDCGIIGASLRTEHYEIAGYHACIAMAQTLGERKIESLLTENLNEEIAAATKITAAAQPILKRSASEPVQEKKPMSEKDKDSDKKSKEDEKMAEPALSR